MYNGITASVRAKVATIVMVSTIVITIAVYVVAATLIRSSYANIEREEMVQNLQQVDDAFQNDVNAMWLKIKDWGFWDDLHAYALDPIGQKEFEEAMFNDNGLVNLDISMIMFIDLDGKIVFKKVIDFETGAEVAGSQTPEHLYAAEKRIIMPPNATAENVTRGIVLLPEGPMLIAAVAILHTDKTGPSAGTLVFGRFIDEKAIDYTGEITHLSLESFPYDSAQDPADVATAKKELIRPHSYAIQPLSENKLAGYSALYDLSGKPILLLRVDTPREVYNQGKLVLLGLTALIGLALLVFGFFTVFFMEKYVIARLSRLSSQVRRIGETHDLSARVEANHKDEVGTLAQTINAMLSDLSVVQEKEANFAKSEKDAVEKIEQHLKEIERLNEMMSGREQKMVEMRDIIKNLKKKLGEA